MPVHTWAKAALFRNSSHCVEQSSTQSHTTPLVTLSQKNHSKPLSLALSVTVARTPELKILRVKLPGMGAPF